MRHDRNDTMKVYIYVRGKDGRITEGGNHQSKKEQVQEQERE